jgi:diguanylate cyclase (GGDEF)-like protein
MSLRRSERPVGPQDADVVSNDSERTPGGEGEHWLSGRGRTALIGGLILAVGLAASVFAASEWRASAVEANRRSFESTAAVLGSALGAKLSANIALTRTTDPAFRKLPGHKLEVITSGRHTSYCLTTAIVGSGAAASLYPGLLDYCAPAGPGMDGSPYPQLVRTATDTGSLIVTPLPATGSHLLVAIGTAVYRRGWSIAPTAARRAALTGFIGTTFDSATMIGAVLTRRPTVTLALYHRNVGAPLELIGRAGANPKGPSPGYSSRRDLGEGWLLETTGTAAAFASPNLRGMVALCLGLLVTVLVFVLYRVLSGSRRRVGERTDELEYRALHDPLTDLPNRILALDRAEQILRRARRLDVPVTALFVDIDGFKQINDRHGRRAGDEVLRQVGARLKAALRENDTVGRLSGDEFVMLIDSVGLYTAPELVAERILDVLRQPIHLAADEREPISITASVGVATGRPGSAEDLMQDADLALCKAKAIGKNGYVKFESAMQTAAQDRIHLEMDLANALELRQLFVVYQPMLDLESEEVVGVEALLRWRHPVSGVVPPDVFIPIAEDSGAIVAIGRWVLQQACMQGARWHRNGYPLNMSVNASAHQLERGEFVEEVRAALHDSGLRAASLTIEITETVLMRKPDQTAQLLADLKALGVRIAVDDFGTGYSSLAYLRQFPVDSLKIDRTFITSLELSSEAHALTHTLIQLGKALGLQTLAEGVEQHSQVRELQREGCDLAQGFLFARPLAPDVVESFLRDSHGLADTFADQPQPARSPAVNAR